MTVTNNKQKIQNNLNFKYNNVEGGANTYDAGFE
jgi:hypothetical protein